MRLAAPGAAAADRRGQGGAKWHRKATTARSTLPVVLVPLAPLVRLAVLVRLTSSSARLALLVSSARPAALVRRVRPVPSGSCGPRGGRPRRAGARGRRAADGV